jgi:PadR family transcriptional regulator, regulatory protein PadR
MPRQMSIQTLAILAVLLADTSQQLYGLEIAKTAGLASGTIYPALARLEREGFLESEREDIDPSVAGRRPRRYYRLTGEGERVGSAQLRSTARKLQPTIGPAGIATT